MKRGDLATVRAAATGAATFDAGRLKELREDMHADVEVIASSPVGSRDEAVRSA